MKRLTSYKTPTNSARPRPGGRSGSKSIGASLGKTGTVGITAAAGSASRSVSTRAGKMSDAQPERVPVSPAVQLHYLSSVCWLHFFCLLGTLLLTLAEGDCLVLFTLWKVPS